MSDRMITTARKAKPCPGCRKLVRVGDPVRLKAVKVQDGKWQSWHPACHAAAHPAKDHP